MARDEQLGKERDLPESRQEYSATNETGEEGGRGDRAG